FMEMNTRLQVEHPVTELVTGLDLVALQVRVAAGEPLGLTQSDVRLSGHAVEARVYAEDPANGFLPTGGRVLAVHHPDAEWLRVDSGIRAGSVVGSDYDPMLAKVIVHGDDREHALRRMSEALAGTAVFGLTTNVAFLRALVTDDDVVAGRMDTQLVDRKVDQLTRAEPVPDAVLVAAAMDEFLGMQPKGSVVDPWELPTGWRLGGAAGTAFRLTCGDRAATVRVIGSPESAEVSIDDGPPQRATGELINGRLRVRYAGEAATYARLQQGRTLWLAANGQVWAVGEHSLLAAEETTDASGGPITSPMPGTVLVVRVEQGERVDAGQPLLVVEAMKMEHTITAPVTSVVTDLPVSAGQKVALDEVLAVVTPETEED